MAHNFKFEKQLFEQGYKIVVGLDEAGRGPLAGPVVAAAAAFLALPDKSDKELKELLKKVKDSKKMTLRQRDIAYNLIIKSKFIKWGTGQVSAKMIDRINILQATKLAMIQAFKRLGVKQHATILIIDGNQKLDLPPVLRLTEGIEQKTVVKGDSKVFLCSCASILAKVTRDRLMQKYHKKYPQYGFAQHKGYPTKQHYKTIKKFGLSSIHRKSFNCG